MGDRPLASLTKMERNWLRRRYCGWCEISCLATRCGARFDLTKPCNMDAQRGVWLASYKPRKPLEQNTDVQAQCESEA